MSSVENEKVKAIQLHRCTSVFGSLVCTLVKMTLSMMITGVE